MAGELGCEGVKYGLMSFEDLFNLVNLVIYNILDFVMELWANIQVLELEESK
jgi:hypothetical protein